MARIPSSKKVDLYEISFIYNMVSPSFVILLHSSHLFIGILISDFRYLFSFNTRWLLIVAVLPSSNFIPLIVGNALSWNLLNKFSLLLAKILHHIICRDIVGFIKTHNKKSLLSKSSFTSWLTLVLELWLFYPHLFRFKGHLVVKNLLK